jgi:formate hydrogenlyase subunit 4
MRMLIPWIHFLAGLALSPLLAGIVNRTRAFFAGRKGQPLLQAYFDIAKGLRKGAVYSRTTTWIFRAGPVIGAAAAVTALTLAPFGGRPAPVCFPGDPIVFLGLFGLMRCFTMLAALDTGSSFEGMGASREALFSALTEPVLMLGFLALARESDVLSLSGILTAASMERPETALVAVSLFIAFLCENSRIPFDDPNTHLELTMIHEVMVLDHGGPDLALIQAGSAVKFWCLGSLIVNLIVPFRPGWAWTANTAAGFAVMGCLAVAVGAIESIMARLRLIRVPQLLAAAAALSALALIFSLG